MSLEKKMITISSELNSTPEASISHPELGLSKHLQYRLSQMNISFLFPVQYSVFPLLRQTQFSSTPISPGDLLVSAPTGSGKTLAYALPIIDSLLDRIIPRIRALIILPTRDLASQVKSCMDQLILGTKLKVTLLTGQSSYKSEVKILSSCQTDILVCTPGRLVDHLQNNTLGLYLQNLRFLVIDESDRLLGQQEYQDWITKILEATHPLSIGSDTIDCFETNSVGVYLPMINAQPCRYQEFRDTYTTLQSYTPLQKLLFSATLSNDITKVACLRLHDPQWICVDSQMQNNKMGNQDLFVAPPTLNEFYLVTDANHDKPQLLFYLLFSQLQLGGVLVFTKSVESAHKLAFLLESVYKRLKDVRKDIQSELSYCHAITSDLYKEKRQEWIQDFQSGKISVLICSDVMSRGMDLGESVQAVINYDIFTDMKAYVHRMGRCARAGRQGRVYSLLESQQVKWFKSQVKNGIQRGNKSVKEIKILKGTEVHGLQDIYKQALDELHSTLS